MGDYVTPLLAMAAVAIGSILQAISGVGAGFMMVPMLAWIDLSLLPGPMIFGSLALSGIMSWRERGAIDQRNLPAILIGLAPGTLIGGWVLSNVPTDQLGLLFGGMILIALGLTVSGLAIPLTRLSAGLCGGIAGAMGASTGMGAPILAILYQHESGARVRSTLALLYTLGSIMILFALAVFGRFSIGEAVSGAALIPGFLAGYWIANRYREQLSVGGSRNAVLVVSGLAAVALILRSLM
ncbi:MAG: sulfite exporter TauE/SafE family protein [Gammaproteobacteria bacterium]|nr:sulfite exporter TauE/SafE family protein [Gammaproteobacteria bacterium]